MPYRKQHPGGPGPLGGWMADLAPLALELASSLKRDDPSMSDDRALMLAQQKLQQERERSRRMTQIAIAGGVGLGALALVLVLRRR